MDIDCLEHNQSTANQNAGGIHYERYSLASISSTTHFEFGYFRSHSLYTSHNAQPSRYHDWYSFEGSLARLLPISSRQNIRNTLPSALVGSCQAPHGQRCFLSCERATFSLTLIVCCAENNIATAMSCYASSIPVCSAATMDEPSCGVILKRPEPSTLPRTIRHSELRESLH